ncbi:MAG: homocysteine S-methyltransferase family protein [Actinomycetota bacterium]
MRDRLDPLPQLRGARMLTDSGIETDVIYHAGRDLPGFALFPLLEDDDGRAILERFYRSHLEAAAAHGYGYVLETPSWRSNPDWGARVGYAQERLDELDRDGVAFLRAIRDTAPAGVGPIAVSGLIGPRGDGYVVEHAMTAEDARRYHDHQVGVFADAGCDLVSGCTITYPAEGIGIALAARDHGVPAMLYFTLEVDGRLPDGTRLADAIAAVDDATGGSLAYFGVNCAHPDHIERALADAGAWTGRIRAIRANASRMSHAELDKATELDDGDPEDLAAGYRKLREVLRDVTVFGGCCGTDLRHVRAVAAAVAGA